MHKEVWIEEKNHFMVFKLLLFTQKIWKQLIEVYFLTLVIITSNLPMENRFIKRYSII